MRGIHAQRRQQVGEMSDLNVALLGNNSSSSSSSSSKRNLNERRVVTEGKVARSDSRHQQQQRRRQQGPPPALPRVPSRIRRVGVGAQKQRPETFSTQSEAPPDAAQIRNRVRYPKKRLARSYDTDRSTVGYEHDEDEDGLGSDVDEIFFTGDSYNTVDFESESFDVPQKSRAHLNLLPAVKQFAIRNGYEVDNDDLELTFRAFFIGGVFALLNATVNMFFAFRYAGGLAQYWVILVAYPIAKATERLPRGLLNPGASVRASVAGSFLLLLCSKAVDHWVAISSFFANFAAGPFSPKEHTIIMTIAIAGSLAGTLGLAGGMLSLDLFFDTRVRFALGFFVGSGDCLVLLFFWLRTTVTFAWRLLLRVMASSTRVSFLCGRS